MGKRLTVPEIISRKGGQPLAALTCYSWPMARLLDPHMDILLVGDSLGMVVYGMESTLAVTPELMIAHGKAVVKGSARALVVVDMPFGSYQGTKEQAFSACARVMAETGAGAVKCEGGRELAETLAFIIARGIPVMGHVGLMPTRVHALGGYKYQGRSEAEASAIMEDARAIEEAGAFAIVIEGVKEDVARAVTAQLKIPTIGIGASPACDGQVLVVDDMLGFSPQVPGFVKHYAHLAQAVEQAAKTYAEEVRNRTFPSAEYCFPFKKN